MIRALWFMAKVAVVIAIAIWLAERPGTLTVEWQGFVVNTTMAMAVLATVVALGAAALLYRLYRAIRTAPSNLADYSRSRRREKGYRALTQGLVAVAAGDPQTARRMARKADELLHDPPLTMLLSAQAAQLTGDERGAKEYFTAMLDQPETAFLGLRGLLMMAIKHGDKVEALNLARRAQQLQPTTPWVLTTLYDLEARAGEWAAAERTLQAAVRAGAVPAEEARQHRAALLLERSFDSERRGRADSALYHAQTAFELLPTFAPAAARYARQLHLAGKTRKATRVVEKAWKLQPHPELADAYRQILERYDAATRLKTFENLTRLSHGNVEGHVALARAAMDAASQDGQAWGEARAHLTRALELQPSPRVYRLLAELERAEHGNEEAASAWLAKSADAPADPAWTCRPCGAVSHDWAGLCGNCGAFDTLEWKTPQVAVHAVADGASALPVPVEAARG